MKEQLPHSLRLTLLQTPVRSVPELGIVETMEDLTLEDWIKETCLISAVTSGPTEPKTFQEAWHSPVEEERNNWQMAIRKEIKSMIKESGERLIERTYQTTEDSLGISGFSKLKEMVPTEQG